MSSSSSSLRADLVNIRMKTCFKFSSPLFSFKDFQRIPLHFEEMGVFFLFFFAYPSNLLSLFFLDVFVCVIHSWNPQVVELHLTFRNVICANASFLLLCSGLWLATGFGGCVLVRFGSHDVSWLAARLLDVEVVCFKNLRNANVGINNLVSTELEPTFVPLRVFLFPRHSHAHQVARCRNSFYPLPILSRGNGSGFPATEAHRKWPKHASQSFPVGQKTI